MRVLAPTTRQPTVRVNRRIGRVREHGFAQRDAGALSLGIGTDRGSGRPSASVRRARARRAACSRSLEIVRSYRARQPPRAAACDTSTTRRASSPGRHGAFVDVQRPQKRVFDDDHFVRHVRRHPDCPRRRHHPRRTLPLPMRSTPRVDACAPAPTRACDAQSARRPARAASARESDARALASDSAGMSRCSTSSGWGCSGCSG